MRLPPLWTSVAALLVLLPLRVSTIAADGPPLTLTIIGPQTVIADDPIFVHEVLKNVSDHVVFWPSGQPYEITLHDATGKVPRHKPGMWVPGESAGTSETIAPGREFEDLPTRVGEEYDLPPGKYTVLYKRHVDPDDPKSDYLTSNEITFIILPAKQMPSR